MLYLFVIGVVVIAVLVLAGGRLMRRK